MLGGLCVGVGRVYNKTNNVLLSAGILFVAAGELKAYTVSPTTLHSQCGAIMSGPSLIMKKGSLMWHLWLYVLIHQRCNHDDELHSPSKTVRISLHHTSHVLRTHAIKSLRVLQSLAENTFTVSIDVVIECGEIMDD